MTRRVMVVDDEPAFADFVRRACVALGCEVETCDGAQSAQARMSDFKPDVVVLDIVMPQIDGVELVRWMATNAIRARVIFVTGFNPHYAEMAQKLAEGAGVEVVATLTKPVRLATLRGAIAAVWAEG